MNMLFQREIARKSRNSFILCVMVGCLFIVMISYSERRHAYVTQSSCMLRIDDFEVWFLGSSNDDIQMRCNNVLLNDRNLNALLALRRDKSRIGPLVIRVESGLSARVVFPLIEMAESYGYSNITIRINETYPDESQLMRMYMEPRKTVLMRVWECAENRICNVVETIVTEIEEIVYGRCSYSPSPSPTP
jgi:hypothetical protein